MTVASLSPVVAWLVDLLTTQSGIHWGDGAAPDSTITDDDFLPYGVVHVVTTARWGAPMNAPDDHAHVFVQLDCVGERQDQARALQDRARSLLLDVDDDGAYLTDDRPLLPLLGGTIAQRTHESGPTPFTPEGEPPDRVFTTTERFQLDVIMEDNP